MSLLDQAQTARQNQNVRTFLDVLAAAEGVKHGYYTQFGNRRLSSLAAHPKQSFAFRQTDGRQNSTTAAGRYQFLGSTWDDVAGKLGLRDFGPESQDLAAIELLRRSGALAPAMRGDFQKAAKLAGSTWASLPSSPYAQPKRSQGYFDSLIAKLKSAPQTGWAGVPMLYNAPVPQARMAETPMSISSPSVPQQVAGFGGLAPIPVGVATAENVRKAAQPSMLELLKIAPSPTVPNTVTGILPLETLYALARYSPPAHS